MPAFGYMLLLNENVHQFLTVRYDGWLLNYLPNIWRIWLLFYDSFFLASATILYSIFCPLEVKSYTSGFAMAEHEAKYRFALREADNVAAEVKYLYQHMPLWMVSYFSSDELHFGSNMYERSDTIGHLSKYFVHRWMILNMWHRGIRGCLYVLYAIGLALVALPAAFTFLQVSGIAVKRLFQ
jgi:hypothetical protein